MRTLFLNPNSNTAITDILRRQIAIRVSSDAVYGVAQLDEAPSIIASQADNLQAESALVAQMRALSPHIERLVLMSSLDTGFELVRNRTAVEVHGFTRSVLHWHRSQGRRLRAVTFDESMTPLYEELFAADGNKGVVRDIHALPISPADVAGASDEVVQTLRRVCRRLAGPVREPVFIVGAVGLAFAETLRMEGETHIIDPVADMLAHLHMRANCL